MYPRYLMCMCGLGGILMEKESKTNDNTTTAQQKLIDVISNISNEQVLEYFYVFITEKLKGAK